VEEPYLGLSKLELNEYDLLILDLTLPEIDGLELIPKIREKSDIPIIISSARDDITDKVIGLERGADDYLPKPYNPRELEARIKSLLRRKRPKNRDLKIVKNDSPFKLNEEQMSISYKNKLLQLTKAEYEILAYLIKHKNGVVSRADIIYNIDAISDDSTYKNIDVIISRIRSKLAKIDPDSSLIKSVRGVGYKLTV
jgi:two-component system OmpR family response regulator